MRTGLRTFGLVCIGLRTFSGILFRTEHIHSAFSLGFFVEQVWHIACNVSGVRRKRDVPTYIVLAIASLVWKPRVHMRSGPVARVVDDSRVYV